MLINDSKRSPPKVEVSLRTGKESTNKKKEVGEHEFKLAKFKNVESKVKQMMNEKQ